jgi:hypothetical protein
LTYRVAAFGIAALGFTACAKDGDASRSNTEAAAAGTYTAPRTPWGDPDLQGIWPGTAMAGTPMQREEKFGTRNVLDDEEFAARAAQFARQQERDNGDFDLAADVDTPGDDGAGPIAPPPHWLERGQPQRQASLIVDPPTGRVPPLTEQGQQRQAVLRQARAGRGPADSYTDRTLNERCITRGPWAAMQPAPTNAGNQIVQSPGYVAIMNEMIHETRVVPLDGRPHVGSEIKQWLGDSRGHWEGDTLVVETTNFTAHTNVGFSRHSEALKITERFTRTAADTLRYRMTVEDPQTWTAPWTWEMPLKRDDGYGMFEYACHEGNYAMFNLLSGARVMEREAAKNSN